MACRGVHFALTKQQEQEILNASDDEELMGVIECIEEKWESEFLVESDKAWDAIHRCLTDGQLRFDRAAYPLSLVICGGKHLHEGADYIVALVSREEVVDVVNGLESVSELWLRERYFTLLNPLEYDGEIGEDDFQYTWCYLAEIRGFFQRAKEAGRSAIFTVDQ